MHVNASELKGSNRCYQRRERNIALSGDKNDVYKKAGIIKAAIKNYFLSRLLDGKDDEVRRIYTDYIHEQVKYDDVPDKDKDVYRYVRSILLAHDELVYSYDVEDVSYIVMASKEYGFIKNFIEDAYIRRLHFLTDVTAEQQADAAVKLVNRYLTFETRTPIIPETEDLNIFGVTVSVKPDFLFMNEDGSIEAVKICCKKPDVTDGGRKKDKAKNLNMELYSLWRYAREWIQTDTEIRDVKASFYFLRRNDDTKDRMQAVFHEPGATNIVTLSEKVTKHNVAKLDTTFKPQFEEYIAGEECTGDTCETCDFCKLCNYAKTPICSKTEKQKKSVSDIDLTPSQEKAVYFRKGVCRINAGAGAGKTLVVALRTAFMLSEGIQPEDILLITFTNAGADEMRERIAMYDEDLGTGTDMSRLRCMTFNAFGDLAIKDRYSDLGFKDEPRLIDDIERKDMIRELLNEYEVPGLDYKNFDMDNFAAKGALAVTSEAFHIIKRERLSTYDVDKLKDLLKKIEGSIDDERAYEKLLTLYDEFDNRLKDRCLIEFQDQERLLFELLAIDPYYLDDFGFKHLIVDEFQDTSDNQIELIKQMMNTKTFESLMVVGDDSQSIFSFRDAVPDNIIHFFDKIGVEGEDIYIVENHRSTPEILDFANKINDLNIRKVAKELTATREHGKEPVVEGFHSVKDEDEFIAKTIKDKINEGISPDDIAVIASTKKELIRIEGVLSENGIETIMQCPEPMMDDSRVQALVALCHILKDVNDTEDIAIYENCLMDGNLLSCTDNEIDDIIKNRQNMIMEFHHKDYDDKISSFNKMAEEIAADDEIAQNLLSRLDGFTSLGDKFDYIDKFVRFGGEELKRDGKYSGVVLTTAHSSKGLEYKVVINSITKYDKKRLNVDEQEERRRLLFVSATRARDELYVTGQYKVGGNERDGYIYNRYVSEAYDVMHKPYDPVDHAAEEKRKKARKRAAETVLKGQLSAI